MGLTEPDAPLFLAAGETGISVTNSEALAPFWAKLYARQSTNVVFIGDSITAGFAAQWPWGSGWPAHLTRALKEIGGDGGTVLPARISELEGGGVVLSKGTRLPAGTPVPIEGSHYIGGARYYLPYYSRPEGWVSTSRNTIRGLGGRAIVARGDTEEIRLPFPSFRYFDLIYAQRASRPHSLRLLVGRQQRTLLTTSPGAVVPRYNSVYTVDALVNAPWAVTMRGMGRGGLSHIEGVRLRTGRPGLIDCNIGWSGVSIHDLSLGLTTDEQRHQYVGAGFAQPDLIVILLGQNDFARHTADVTGQKLATFISSIKDLAPILYVIYPPNVSDRSQARRQFFHRTVKNWAVGTGASISVADCSQMRGWETVSRAISNGFYTSDNPTHPTDLGHQDWGRKLFAAIHPG